VPTGDLDATVHADPAYVLGMAAGALTLDDARALGLAEIDGDESIICTVSPPRSPLTSWLIPSDP
jgi:hypothetical protein